MTLQSIRDRIMSRTLPQARAPEAREADHRQSGGAPRNAPHGAPEEAPGEARGPRWPRRRVAALCLGGLALVAGAGLGAMQVPAVRALMEGETAPSTAASDPPAPDTPFQAHAKEAGLKACANVFPVLGQLLAGGAHYSLRTDWNVAAPDKHAVRSLLGLDLRSQDYSGPATGIVFAAPNGDACEGAMVRIVPYLQPCASVAAALPEGSTLSNALGATQVYDLANKSGQVLLLPADQTCVVITLAQATGS